MNKQLYNIKKIASADAIKDYLVADAIKDNFAIGGITALGTGAGMIGGEAAGKAARDAIALRWEKILERLQQDALKNDLVRPSKVLKKITSKGLNPLLLATHKHLPGVGKILGALTLGLTSGLTANQLIRKPKRLV